MNLYAYVGNEPVNMIDPMGMEMECTDDGKRCTTTKNLDEILEAYKQEQQKKRKNIYKAPR